MKANDIPYCRSTVVAGVLAMLSLLACAVPLLSQERAAAPRLLIPIADVQSMLGLYGARGRVQMGLEKLPGSAEPGLPREVPPLDLTGVPPADGVRRILATDPRYISAPVKGILNIRPKASAGRPSELLDRIVTRFTLRGQSATVLMDRLPPIFGLDPPEQPRPAKGKLLTLDLQGVSLRDVLNEICRAEGTLSWTFHAQPGPEGRTALSLELRSFDGWSTGTSLRVK
jgi:hypothetical protein